MPASSSHAPIVVVVGGGHAGVEAALACARLGCAVTLVTLDARAIGRMSCNPSVGGLAKGQLVREIDACGGLMGVAADFAALQFRMLNTRKGPAVQSPRAQVDKERYASFVRGAVERTRGVTVVAGQVRAVHERGGRLEGLELCDGHVLRPDAAVLTTGTFLRGLMHVGDKTSAGGRVDEAPAQELSASLAALGLELVRLKTGTPPRVHRDSVDLLALEPHGGHPDDGRFSHFVAPPPGRVERVSRVTATSEAAHDLVRANMHRSPYGRGDLLGTGPRYCPSLEDKVRRFAHKPAHRVFVEHETADGPSLYLNGLSMCLPAYVQEEIVRAVPGLERARMLRPGYAVEYDALPAWQLRPTLECRAVGGLFLAGQINGTSGYEEAAAQGLVAGLNAARHARGEPGVVLGRHEAYVGVLIDDLVTSSPREPYRMFTSRAEYRLVLRQDNAHRRLSAKAHAWGLLDATSAARVARLERRVREADAALGADDAPLRRRLRAGASFDELAAEQPRLAALGLDADERGQLELDVRYEGYVERQAKLLERLEGLGALPLPESFDYERLPGLGNEAREVLQRVRPVDLGQAARLSGVTRADLSLLAIARTRTAPV
ncbi:MAG: tRNA uridine-5-carboxymethylaminomethyl(34) synthesis enzyme MnmG [Planctomycetes bacterium]|nr:tRNA uridine-5-carboxymethylaminomethyl(34) synthesis enzyme MnmG [Planctomycetota bacterium]